MQLAKWAGARVIATGRSDARSLALELGADAFVDLDRDRWEDEVGQVDVVFDTVGGDTLARSSVVVKPGGALVSIVETPMTDRDDIHAVYFIRVPSGAQLTELARLVDDGRVRPQVGAVYPLADAREAFRVKANHGIPGKVVLEP